MIGLALAVLLVIAVDGASGSCIVQGPEPAVVRAGSPVTFSCVTHSTNAYWIINGRRYMLGSDYGSPLPSLYLTRSDDGNERINLTAVAETTNRSFRTGQIVCACSDLGSSIYTPHRSALANWGTSCLAERNETEIQARVSILNYEAILVGVVQVQFPADCLSESVHYHMTVGHNNTHTTNATIEGISEFGGQDLLLTTGGLMKSGRYHMSLKARTFLIQEWVRIEIPDIDSSPLLPTVSSVSPCNSSQLSNHGPSSLALHPSNTNALVSSTPLLATVVVLGVLLQLLVVVFIVVVVSFIIHRKKHSKRSSHQRTMVTNPIYAGPVYESIHPQFRSVNNSHAPNPSGTDSGGDVAAVKDEEVEGETEEEEPAMVEFEPTSPEPLSSPRYLCLPKPHPLKNSLIEQDMVEEPLPNPSTSTSTQETPPTQNKHRNVLGLTLNLTESGGTTGSGVNGGVFGGGGVSNRGGVSRVLDLDLDSGRQTRRRAATIGPSRPLLQSYFSSSSTPEDDHYTVMSPVGNLSTTTATATPTTVDEGRSFLRPERRRNQDHSTTLI